MSLRVVKVGGSLLTLVDLVPRLRVFLAHQTQSDSVIVVGGGAHADHVRQLDQRVGLTDEQAHRLSIRAMTLGTWILAQCDEAWLYVDDWHRLNTLLQHDRRPCATVLFDAATFLENVEPRREGTRLPVGWSVTSDSIAARIAFLLGAEELVLLKRATTRAATLDEASQLGYVDSFFPRVARSLSRVRAVELVSHDQSIWTSSHPTPTERS